MLTGGFFSTYIIAVPIVTWILTQAVKILLYGRYRQFRSWRDLFKSGGMPSAHSSFMCALCVAVYVREGLLSTPFAITLSLTGIVVYDAIHVRLESGRHASILNEVYQNGQIASRVLEESYPLETSIGHTVNEVAGGIVFGTALGFLLMSL